MDEIATRLTTCFQTVFPNLLESDIPGATQLSTADWDSIGAITLLNVIEDEFGISVDFDLLPELDSFSRIHEYLRNEMRKS